MADKLVIPWECPSENCGSSAVTATEMVNMFGHYVTAANPDDFIFFKTCGACNDDIDVVCCVDCPESAERQEEAQIKFGDDYAEEERRVKKGRKTGVRCRECLEKAQQRKEKKKTAKRVQVTPDASEENDEGKDKPKEDPLSSPKKKTLSTKTRRKTAAKKK